MEESWQVLEEVAGSGLAEVLRGLLEAQDILVLLSQEGAGHFVYPTTVGSLGKVQILVPVSQYEKARQILAAYQSGELEAQVEDVETETFPETEDEAIESDD